MKNWDIKGASGKEIIKIYINWVLAGVAIIVLAYFLNTYFEPIIKPYVKYGARWYGGNISAMLALIIPIVVVLFLNRNISKGLPAVWKLSFDEEYIYIQFKSSTWQVLISTIKRMEYDQIETGLYHSHTMSERGRRFKIYIPTEQIAIHVDTGYWTPFSTSSDIEEMDVFFKALTKKLPIKFDEAMGKDNIRKFTYNAK